MRKKQTRFFLNSVFFSNSRSHKDMLIGYLKLTEVMFFLLKAFSHLCSSLSFKAATQYPKSGMGYSIKLRMGKLRPEFQSLRLEPNESGESRGGPVDEISITLKAREKSQRNESEGWNFSGF